MALPVLLFCIAFGLSMDYEVFLLSQDPRGWYKTGRRADNDERREGLAAPDASSRPPRC